MTWELSIHRANPEYELLYLVKVNEKIMELTLHVEVDSPAAVAMVLDNMDAAADPKQKLTDAAMVHITFILQSSFKTRKYSLSCVYFFPASNNFSSNISTGCFINASYH